MKQMLLVSMDIMTECKADLLKFFIIYSFSCFFLVCLNVLVKMF